MLKSFWASCLGHFWTCSHHFWTQNAMWGHSGHVDVILDATWGPRGAIRLNLGVILGSNWAQFWVQNDIKIHVKKTMIFG